MKPDVLEPDVEAFRARGGRFRLGAVPTRIPDLYDGDADARRLLAAEVDRIGELQERLYAANRWALLLVFQAMDAAGKDGTIRAVLSGVDPLGCQAFAFKQPSAVELDHDFLWRTSQCLPERGRIGVFNRSYYEEVLVVRVHPEYLQAQRLPGADARKPAFWRQRFESIRDHERHLHRNGTKVVKFFLHVSRQEQRKRFLARLDEPSKHWKFNRGDVAERALWPRYMRAYEDCIRHTSTDEAPWYAVPADDKKNLRLIVARIVAHTLQSMDPRPPRVDARARAELRAARALLVKQR